MAFVAGLVAAVCCPGHSAVSWRLGWLKQQALVGSPSGSARSSCGQGWPAEDRERFLSASDMSILFVSGRGRPWSLLRGRSWLWSGVAHPSHHPSLVLGASSPFSP